MLHGFHSFPGPWAQDVRKGGQPLRQPLVSSATCTVLCGDQTPRWETQKPSACYSKIANSQGPLQNFLPQEIGKVWSWGCFTGFGFKWSDITLLELVSHFSLSVTKEPADQALLCPLPSVPQILLWFCEMASAKRR